jgi:hypothetical protein
MKKTLVPSLLAFVFALSTHLSADILVQYDFETWDASPARTLTPQLQGSLLTSASDLSVSADSSAHGYTTYGDNSSIPFQTQGTSPLIDGYYFQNNTGTVEFTLTPDQSVNLSSLKFGVGASNDNGATYEVSSSLTTGTLDSGDITTTIGSEGDYQDVSIDLTGFSGLQNFSSPITFSIVLDAPSGNSTTRIDKIQVEGAVIPEPTSIALLGLMGLAALLGLRRRKV